MGIIDFLIILLYNFIKNYKEKLHGTFNNRFGFKLDKNGYC